MEYSIEMWARFQGFYLDFGVSRLHLGKTYLSEDNINFADVF